MPNEPTNQSAFDDCLSCKINIGALLILWIELESLWCCLSISLFLYHVFFLLRNATLDLLNSKGFKLMLHTLSLSLEKSPLHRVSMLASLKSTRMKLHLPRLIYKEEARMRLCVIMMIKHSTQHVLKSVYFYTSPKLFQSDFSNMNWSTWHDSLLNYLNIDGVLFFLHY